MAAYYNEIDPFAAAWLRNLMAAGLIPDGEVDERSILDVEPGDLRSFRQCHFFAGIGGWPHALDLAGWDRDRCVWTGSCPCQPLSSAGQRKGHADERHLWPAFYRLIAERRPATVFGEQVASKDGREWLAGVRADLEHLGYAIGVADLCAAGVGAPHIRQRLYWVAQSDSGRWNGLSARSTIAARTHAQPQGSGGDGWVADAQRGGREHSRHDEREHAAPGRPERNAALDEREPGEGCCAEGGRLADAASERGREGWSRRQSRAAAWLRDEAQFDHWQDAVWLACLDGKARRVEPTIQPLAHGIPNRVGLLRGSGNAIVPQVAAQFIGAVMELA